MWKHNRIRSSKLAKKKRQILIWRFCLYTIFIISLIVGLSYLLKYEKVQIDEINISGSTYVNNQELLNLVTSEISSDYFGIFSKSNIFIYPKRSIKRKFIEEFASIKDVKINLQGFKVLDISIDEHHPVARWCRIIEDEIGENLGGESMKKDCYFLNDEGVVFVKEPILHTKNFPTYYGLIDGNPMRKNYSNPNLFKSLTKFNNLVETRLNIFISKVEAVDSEAFYLTTKTGAVLRIDSNDDLLTVFDNLQTVIDRDAINEAQFGNIEYIDLRFGNRVFYKLK